MVFDEVVSRLRFFHLIISCPRFNKHTLNLIHCIISSVFSWTPSCDLYVLTKQLMYSSEGYVGHGLIKQQIMQLIWFQQTSRYMSKHELGIQHASSSTDLEPERKRTQDIWLSTSAGLMIISYLSLLLLPFGVSHQSLRAQNLCANCLNSFSQSVSHDLHYKKLLLPEDQRATIFQMHDMRWLRCFMIIQRRRSRTWIELSGILESTQSRNFLFPHRPERRLLFFFQVSIVNSSLAACFSLVSPPYISFMYQILYISWILLWGCNLLYLSFTPFSIKFILFTSGQIFPLELRAPFKGTINKMEEYKKNTLF